MKLKSIIALTLVISALFMCGCRKESVNDTVYSSENFTFDYAMAVYMASYTKMMLTDEMAAAGVDTSLSLAEQIRREGESWADYLYKKTLENTENILLYCEAANADGYTVSEGMRYKANELMAYIVNAANQAGYTSEEYVRMLYGNSVTLDAIEICTQMMALCESYELDLAAGFDVTEEEAEKYADENPKKFLRFDALRYTTDNKAVAESLAASKDSSEFLAVMSGISGYSLTDSDKNGTPDVLEVRGAYVSSDAAGEFASSDGRSVGDTSVTEKDGKYTVTMITSLPERSSEPVWTYRMLYLSTESSTDPLGDAESLLDQWNDKKGGEEGFSNLCSRYSDAPSAYYGGLISNVTSDEMPTAELRAWICDSARTEGNTTAISDGEDGAYMLYYISGNTPEWVSEATSAVKNEKAKEKLDSVKGQIEEKYSLSETAMLAAVGEISK